MLTLELAVVLPATALVILSALHLKEIQRDRGVQAAFQRDFSQVLVISEKQMNQKAYDMIDEVRDEIPSSGSTCSETLDRILATHPYVSYLFVYDPAIGLVFRTQPDKANNPAFRPERDYLSGMFNAWIQVEYKEIADDLEEMSKKGRRHGFSDWVPRGDKHAYVAGQLFLTSDSSGKHRAIAGMVFDADYLHDQFFPQMLDEVLSHQEEKGEKNHVAMLLRPKYENTTLAASAGWDGGDPEVERNMEGAFPGLTLGIKMSGTTLAAMEQHFVRTSFLILGGITLLLAGGITLTGFL